MQSKFQLKLRFSSHEERHLAIIVTATAIAIFGGIILILNFYSHQSNRRIGGYKRVDDRNSRRFIMMMVMIMMMMRIEGENGVE